MTAHRRSASCCVVAAAADSSPGKLLVIGGGSNISPITSEYYDAPSNRWVPIEAVLSEGRSRYPCAALAGSCALVAQSCTLDFTRCEMLDVRMREWLRIASPSVARQFHTVVSISEHLVAMVGGCGRNSDKQDELLIYDVRFDCWTARSEWKLPAGGNFPSAVTFV